MDDDKAMQKIEPAQERTWDLATWAFWLGVYSLLTHKVKSVKLRKVYGKDTDPQ